LKLRTISSLSISALNFDMGRKSRLKKLRKENKNEMVECESPVPSKRSDNISRSDEWTLTAPMEKRKLPNDLTFAWILISLVAVIAVSMIFFF